MSVKVEELMAKQVVSAQPHHSVDHVRGMMERNHVHAIPVSGPDGEPVGIVSSADLSADLKGGSHISQIMAEKVYTIPPYEDVHIAARMMRNHKIHHLVVTHEKTIVGILSSLDLLKLVEGHRYVAKPGPAESKKKAKQRA